MIRLIRTDAFAAGLGVLAGLAVLVDLRLTLPAALLLLVLSLRTRSAVAMLVAAAIACLSLATTIRRAAAMEPLSASELGMVLAVICGWAAIVGAGGALLRTRRWLAILVLPLLALAMFDLRVRAERMLGPVQRESRYLAMRDGVRIAVDVYRPRGFATARLPAIVEQTRYHRSMVFRWPASLLLDAPRPDIRRFVEHGYAYVFVDARGSGASFGSRRQEWSPDEVEDGGQVVDWIVAQPWSSGAVGATGISYNGTAAELLASTGRRAVRAVAPRFCMFDVYADVSFPGGVPQRWFTRRWGAFNRALDSNRLGAFLGGLQGWLIDGVRPVDSDPDGRLLAAAVAEHAANYDVAAFVDAIVFRDDRGPTGSTLDDLSTFPKADRIRAASIPVFLWSGWFDAGNQRAAIAKFLTYRNPGSRLIIGPWDHGARQNISPHNREKALFDQAGELIRFFDHHLKGAPNGFDRTPPIRYFEMGAERWRHAARWPVPTRALTLFLAPGGRLSDRIPDTAAPARAYVVDRDARSGPTSRWLSAVNIRQVPIGYPDRAAQDRRLLVYDSAPLPRALEIVGHPIISLSLASSARDANVFVYLEDVGPDGSVTYVTEGMLRALHRRERPSREAPYAQAWPYRSFGRSDGELLEAGKPAVMRFDLLPTAYQFAAGHRVRIAIAGGDLDHAARPIPSRWVISQNTVHPSSIVLPAASHPM